MPNYFVVYKGTGEKELVPEAIALAIWEAKTPKIRWKSKNGLRTLDLITVANLYNEEEYYLLHPEERPTVTETHKELPPPKKYTRPEAISALNSMIKGLSGFIKREPNSPKAKALLEKMKERLELAKSGDANLETIKDLINFNNK